jgi:hypothetical protein
MHTWLGNDIRAQKERALKKKRKPKVDATRVAARVASLKEWEALEAHSRRPPVQTGPTTARGHEQISDLLLHTAETRP